MRLDEQRFAEVDDATHPGVDPPNDFPDYVGTRLRAPKQPLVILPANRDGADRARVRGVGGRAVSTPTSRGSTPASRSGSGSSSRAASSAATESRSAAS